MSMFVVKVPKGRLYNHPDLVGILLNLRENLNPDQCVIGVEKSQF